MKARAPIRPVLSSVTVDGSGTGEGEDAINCPVPVEAAESRIKLPPLVPK